MRIRYDEDGDSHYFDAPADGVEAGQGERRGIDPHRPRSVAELAAAAEDEVAGIGFVPGDRTGYWPYMSTLRELAREAARDEVEESLLVETVIDYYREEVDDGDTSRRIRRRLVGTDARARTAYTLHSWGEDLETVARQAGYNDRSAALKAVHRHARVLDEAILAERRALEAAVRHRIEEAEAMFVFASEEWTGTPEEWLVSPERDEALSALEAAFKALYDEEGMVVAVSSPAPAAWARPSKAEAARRRQARREAEEWEAAAWPKQATREIRRPRVRRAEELAEERDRPWRPAPVPAVDEERRRPFRSAPQGCWVSTD